jgi:TP901 family phage tail tape measure protein
MTKEIRIGGIRVDAILGLKKWDSGAQKYSRSLKQIRRDTDASAKAMKVALTGSVLAAGAAITAFSIKAAADFDAASRSIRVATGATGKALQDLEKSFTKTLASVPNSARDVATAIGDLNTRLGLSGKPLEDLSTQVLNLSRITQTEVGALVQSQTRVLGDWGVSAEEAGGKLDLLFKASQSTGIGVDELGRKIVQFGAPLRQFGFSLEEAAALLGKFEKEGVNTEAVFSGFRALAPKLAKDNIDLAEGFRALAERVKGAKTESEALAIAIAGFGSRAGADFSAAIREGRFEIDGLVASLQKSPETINKAAEDSKGVKEQFQELSNVAGAVLGPGLLALLEDVTSLVGGIGDLRTIIQEGITQRTAEFNAAMESFSEGFNTFKEGAQAARDIVVELFKALSPFSDSKIDFLGDQGIVEQIARIKVEEQRLAKAAAEAAAAERKSSLERRRLIKERINDRKEETEAVKEVGTVSEETETKVDKFLKGTLSGSKGAIDEVKKLRDEFAKLASSFDSGQAEDSLRGQIESAIEGVDSGAFTNLLAQGREFFTDKFLDDLRERFGTAISESDLVALAQKQSKEIVDDYAEQFDKKQREVYQEGVDFWRKTFENAITGVSFDLKDLLKQIAVGFAAEFAQSLFGSVQGIGSPQDLGGSIFNSIFGGGGLGDIIGGLTGSGGGSGGGGGLLGSVFSGGLAGRAPGVQGPLLPDGSFGTSIFDAGTNFSAALDATGFIIAATNAAAALGQLGESTESTISGLATIGGTAIGSIFGPEGAAIGSTIGQFAGDFLGSAFGGGPTNPETLARIAVFKKLDELIGKIGGLKFFDSQGNLQTIDKFDLGSDSRFNAGNFSGSALFDEFGGTVNAFTGIGETIKELFGITEDIGQQIGVVLLDQFGGDIEGLKALVGTLGISFEDVRNVLLNLGKEGSQSWLSIISQINEASRAYEKGIEGVGQYQQAAQNFYNTAGRGQISLNQLQNLGIEGLEAELTTTDELIQKLRESGKFSEEFLAGIQEGLEQQGITTLEQLANAGEETLARIVAATDAAMQDAGIIWDDQLAKVKEYQEAINEVDGAKIKVEFFISSKLDANTQAVIDAGLPLPGEGSSVSTPSSAGPPEERLAAGGIFSGPTRFFGMGRQGLIGEAGPEAVLPLRRSGGKLGVDASGMTASQSIQFNIDASGNGIDTEQRIVDALTSLREHIIEQVRSMI